MSLRFRFSFKRVLNLFAYGVDYMILYDAEIVGKQHQMSLVMRKMAFCICENKDADQLRGNLEADQRLCFRYTDNTIHILT